MRRMFHIQMWYKSMSRVTHTKSCAVFCAFFVMRTATIGNWITSDQINWKCVHTSCTTNKMCNQYATTTKKKRRRRIDEEKTEKKCEELNGNTRLSIRLHRKPSKDHWEWRFFSLLMLAYILNGVCLDGLCARIKPFSIWSSIIRHVLVSITCFQ